MTWSIGKRFERPRTASGRFTHICVSGIFWIPGIVESVGSVYWAQFPSFLEASRLQSRSSNLQTNYGGIVLCYFDLDQTPDCMTSYHRARWYCCNVSRPYRSLSVPFVFVVISFVSLEQCETSTEAYDKK